MLKKLSGLGLSNNTCNWFKSYLTDRKQCTIANDCISTYKPVVYGVPQGSVLGPVLFSIYINSLPQIDDFNITLYADDAVISVHDHVKMQSCLNSLSAWCKKNSLTVNEKKTKWMLYNNINNLDPVFTLNNVVIERVYTFQYLGLTLDPELKFVAHRQNAMANVRHKINQLVKVRAHVDRNTALTVYKSMVIPTIDYADFIWDRDNMGENRDLQYLQNRGLRSVYKIKLEKNPGMTTDQLHNESKCNLLGCRRDMHLLYFAYSLSTVDKYIDKRILPTRRHLGKRLIVPRSLKPIVLRSCLYRGITRWNDLKPLYTVIDTLWKFKLAIRKDYPNCFINAH